VGCPKLQVPGRLPGLGEALDTRERGSMIHEVFARFVEEGHDFAAPDATAIMLHMAEEEFGGLDAIGDRRDLWLSRFAVAARQYLDWELQRHERVRTRRAEIKGSWTLPAAEPFTITGKADRIDVLKDGSLEILDFKTGSIPDKKTMKAFEAPQLLLEARMAAAGAFGPELVGAASALIYLKLGLGPEALDESPFGLDDDTSLADAVAEIESRLARQVEALLLSGERPMVSALKPALNRRYAGDYDHLARMAEWTADGEEEAE
jgi:ATP-dependent helicase/nuclease subunit B